MRIRKVQNLVSVKRVNIIDASCWTRISTKEWKLEINFVFGKLQGIRSKYFKLSCLYLLLYVYFIFFFFCVVAVFKYVEVVCQLIPDGSLREVRGMGVNLFFRNSLASLMYGCHTAQSWSFNELFPQTTHHFALVPWTLIMREFPHDIQLHMTHCSLWKNFSNKRCIGTMTLIDFSVSYAAFI